MIFMGKSIKIYGFRFRFSRSRQPIFPMGFSIHVPSVVNRGHRQREPQLEGAEGRDVDAEGAIGLDLASWKTPRQVRG